MAPPRQRAPANLDDSRSEASSGTREHKGTGSKGRKPANVSAAAISMAPKDMRVAATVAAVNGLPAGEDAGLSEELPAIPWSDMSLETLHDYRHAFRLPTPSAYSRSYNRILLTQGIGLRSPTAVAARRAQSTKPSRELNGSAPEKDSSDSASTGTLPGQLVSQHTIHTTHRLHRIIGQGRVSKDQLALSVRKHFNSAGLVEQEAIVRFLYKVREEGKGREFRLRFQP
ncbi:hypothetical protein Plec18167_001469 [Paecilomyces lecythidis]|uniref:Histone deacetylase complex subunit SAP30 Sin3 binding domain-containing protein n=1 Tax=Paecilomyces lecythidis TaxID=3004212 RepID=A0ABR3YCC9_9EURO